MTRQPSLEAILTEFEAEIARAPRFASVDRDLLARVCGELRRWLEREAPVTPSSRRRESRGVGVG